MSSATLSTGYPASISATLNNPPRRRQSPQQIPVKNPNSQSSIDKSNFLSLLAPPLAAAILALSPPYPSPHQASMAALASTRGEAIFNKACIGCHVAGGNILQPGASLFTADLERNGIVTEEDIYKITYFGKNRMPGFGEKCTPRGQCTFGPRLQEEEIRQLAEFIKLQAADGWPKVELQD